MLINGYDIKYVYLFSDMNCKCCKEWDSNIEILQQQMGLQILTIFCKEW